MKSVKEIFDWSDPKLFTKESVPRRCCVLVIVFIANLLIGIEGFGVTVSYDHIRGYFAIDEPRKMWIGTLFFLGLALPMPIFNFFSSRLSKKKCYAIGLVALLIGCLACSMTESYYQMLIGRLITGIGGGFIIASTPLIIKRVVIPRFHGVALTLNTYMVFGLGLAIAMIIGGVIGQSLHWRLDFFLDVTIAAVALLILWVTFKEGSDECQREKIDFVAYGYFVGFLGSLAIFISQSKAPWNTLGWRSDFTLGFIAASITFLGLLVRRCVKNKDHPLFDFSLLKHKEVLLACCIIMILALMIFGSNTMWIFTLEQDFLYEHITTGKMMTIFGLSLFSFGLLTFLMRYIKPVFFVVTGLALIAASCFVNHALTFLSEPVDIFWILFLRGAGVGLSLQPTFVYAAEAIAPIEASTRLIGVFQQVIAGVGSNVLSTYVVMRQAFHSLRFGEQVNIYSAKFQNFIRTFQVYTEDQNGVNAALALEKAKQVVRDNIVTQAHIASFNDAFFIIGWICVFLIVAVVISALYQQKQADAVEA